jgi:hypothetical protein
MISINGSDVSPMVMMTTMMASTPSVVVASTAVMTPAMATAVAVTVDLDNRVVSADQRIGVCTRHRRRGQDWSERESAGCKSDQ